MSTSFLQIYSSLDLDEVAVLLPKQHLCPLLAREGPTVLGWGLVSDCIKGPPSTLQVQDSGGKEHWRCWGMASGKARNSGVNVACCCYANQGHAKNLEQGLVLCVHLLNTVHKPGGDKRTQASHLHPRAASESSFMLGRGKSHAQLSRALDSPPTVVFFSPLTLS